MDEELLCTAQKVMNDFLSRTAALIGMKPKSVVQDLTACMPMPIYESELLSTKDSFFSRPQGSPGISQGRTWGLVLGVALITNVLLT